MWISRDDWQRVVEAQRTAEAEARGAREQVAGQKSTLDWMRVQINTIQAEKAALLSALTKTPVLTPTIRAADSSPLTVDTKKPEQVNTFLSELSAVFEDVGDDAAKALNIDHDEKGGVVYR